MGRRLKFLFIYFFFVNRFDCCFFFYSVLPSSLLNAKLHFHVIHPHLIIQHKVFALISFHFIFSFLKNKKNKILCNFTCDLLLCLWISDLKCGQAKNSQVNGSLRENVSVFFALISRRNVGMRGHLREEITLLKYQFFRFRTKSGGQFELLN